MRKTILSSLGLSLLSATVAIGQTIPESMLGEWATSAQECSDPYSDMRVRIAADGITFYESMGMLTEMDLSEPYRISGRFDFQYAEDRWTQDIGLSVAPDRSALSIQHPGQDPVQMVPCS